MKLNVIMKSNISGLRLKADTDITNTANHIRRHRFRFVSVSARVERFPLIYFICTTYLLNPNLAIISYSLMLGYRLLCCRNNNKLYRDIITRASTVRDSSPQLTRLAMHWLIFLNKYEEKGGFI